MAVCRSCRKEKPPEAFGVYRNGERSGRRKTCTTCRHRIDREKYWPKRKGRSTAFYRGRKAECWRKQRAKRYGISVEKLDSLLASANGICAICKNTFSTLCVDHDHKTGLVRGMLCRRCNLKLDSLEDCEWVESAKVYLDRHLQES